MLRDQGEVFLLRHTAGPDAVSWVEQVDAITLEPLARSDRSPRRSDVAGRHRRARERVAARRVRQSRAPPRAPTSRCSRRASSRVTLPYNSFVIVPDGHLVTKDFGGVLPGADPGTHTPAPAELLVLDPETLEIVCELRACPNRRSRASRPTATPCTWSARSTLFRAHWDGTRLALDDEFAGRYRTIAGQTYGWDAVLALGAAWFLDNGEGSERYVGTFRGQGISSAPLHLVRVDLTTAAVTLTEICGLPNGVVANPPVVDEARRIVVGYDSGNGVLAAFDIATDGSTTPRWRREQNHACHPLLFADTGELVTNDHDATRMADAIVVLDIETGHERVRVDAGSPVQSVLFPAAGFGRDLYYCSFSTLTRVSAGA